MAWIHMHEIGWHENDNENEMKLKKRYGMTWFCINVWTNERRSNEWKQRELDLR